MGGGRTWLRILLLLSFLLPLFICSWSSHSSADLADTHVFFLYSLLSGEYWNISLQKREENSKMTFEGDLLLAKWRNRKERRARKETEMGELAEEEKENGKDIWKEERRRWKDGERERIMIMIIISTDFQSSHLSLSLYLLPLLTHGSPLWKRCISNSRNGKEEEKEIEKWRRMMIFLPGVTRWKTETRTRWNLFRVPLSSSPSPSHWSFSLTTVGNVRSAPHFLVSCPLLTGWVRDSHWDPQLKFIFVIVWYKWLSHSLMSSVSSAAA